MKSRLTLLLTFILGAKFIYTHPHVFIDYKLELLSDTRASVEWVFDPLESEKVIYFFDDNEDGKINESEIEALYNERFINLENYNFFLYLKKNSTQYNIDRVTNFKAGVNPEGNLYYYFEFPIPKIDNEITKITFFDTGYFVSFSEPNGESLIKPDSIYSSIRKNRDTPYYYDPAAGVGVILDTSKPQPGWQKVYPTEILISTEPIAVNNSLGLYLFKDKFIELQKNIYLKLSDYLLNLNEGFSFELILILLLSLAYGIVHAIGPGHRKVVLTSYLLSKDSSYKEAVYLSLLSALLHSSSGVSIVLILYYLFNTISDGNLAYSTGIINSISGIILIVLVVFITLSKILRKKAVKTDREIRLEKSAILLSSLIPCPGAATIMIVGISFGMIQIGIVSVLLMSTGIGITLMGISLLAIKGKRLSGKTPIYRYLSLIIEWGALGILFIFGITLFTLGG